MNDLIVDVGAQIAERMHLQAGVLSAEADAAEQARAKARREFLGSAERDPAKRAEAQRQLQSLGKRAQQLRRNADKAAAEARRAHLAAGLDPDLDPADIQAVRLVPVSAAEVKERAAAAAEHAWVVLRAERDALLAASDWTQLGDIPEKTRDAWAKYRQQLRDLPASTKNPSSVSWPKAP